MKKIIPIGYEDFKEIVEKDLYYVDKTLMIKDIVDGEKVNHFTRPRRFGKTLNLSMLRRFFEDERGFRGEKIDNSHLFEGLKISDAGEKYLAMQQQYPVIKLSLKSAKQPTYEMAYYMLKSSIIDEFQRHQYIMDDKCFDEKDRMDFKKIIKGESEETLYIDALQFLSKCLAKYHGKNVIILIDEYDVPLENAYFCGFYNEMIAFIRSLFESALKTNDNLEFAVVTGCLRISKESIFTGLNNLAINSVMSNSYSEYFGFLQHEVDEMLDFYDLNEKRDEVKAWYDGYMFGNKEIYNPWSIINYVNDKVRGDARFPKPYWANTSSNDIIRELVENADAETRMEMEGLISGETIKKPVHEDITYGDIQQSMDNLWNFLFFTGYMKNCGEEQEGEQIYMNMCIPNLEIKSIYKREILNWFDKKIKNTELDNLYEAIQEENTEKIGQAITAQLQDTISFFDYAENYYHGFLAGVLKGMPGYRVVSNREIGDGRADLILVEKKFMGNAIIFELKITDDFTKMEESCRQALMQIEKKNYDAELKADGYSEIKKYGICFYKKGCKVEKSE